MPVRGKCSSACRIAVRRLLQDRRVSAALRKGNSKRKGQRGAGAGGRDAPRSGLSAAAHAWPRVRRAARILKEAGAEVIAQIVVVQKVREPQLRLFERRVLGG